MKKFVLFLVAVAFLNACSVDDNNPNYRLEVLPVESFTVPASFTLGETYPIRVRYRKPSDCYFFQTFYYERQLNTRTVGVVSRVVEGKDCLPTPSTQAPVEVSFNFLVNSNGSYIFKFYKGEDANGEDIFEEVEIPVN
jgi:hypothetical protein